MSSNQEVTEAAPLNAPTPTLAHHEHEVQRGGGRDSIKCITSYRLSTENNTIPSPTLLFTHGAAGTLHAPRTLHFREGYAAEASITCFQGSGMLIQSRVDDFNLVIDQINQELGAQRIMAIGGRSMGAQAAAYVARSRSDIKALVLGSYPLTKNGVFVLMEILAQLAKNIKVLFIIGDKDSMCDLEKLKEIRGYMRAMTWFLNVAGVDHALKIESKIDSEVATQSVGEKAAMEAAKWVRRVEDGSLNETETEGKISWDDEKGEVKFSGWEDKAAMSSRDAKDEKIAEDKRIAEIEAAKPVKRVRKPKKAVEHDDDTDLDDDMDTEMAKSSKAKKPLKKGPKSKQFEESEDDAEFTDGAETAGGADFERMDVDEAGFGKAESSKANGTSRRSGRNTMKSKPVMDSKYDMDIEMEESPKAKKPAKKAAAKKTTKSKKGKGADDESDYQP